MPELPEVETVMRGLASVMTGTRIVRAEQRRADLRFPLPDRMPERLAGRRIEKLSRRAKYILIHLDRGEILFAHLGMTGRFTIGSAVAGAMVADGAFARNAGGDPRHDHVLLHLSNKSIVTYNDARRFGYIELMRADEMPTHKLFRDLGIEPMSDDLTPDYLAANAAGRRVDLKAFLMDQHVIAGLGNIYVSEALYRARLKPTRMATTIADRRGRPRPQAAALTASVREVLADAIAAGGSSLRNYVQASGELGYFQKAHAVYDRAGQPCLRGGCDGTVRRIVQGTRATFYCPKCQR